jgi:hypothetical protein
MKIGTDGNNALKYSCDDIVSVFQDVVEAAYNIIAN